VSDPLAAGFPDGRILSRLSGPMCQIQLPNMGLSTARAPTGAMTKIESNVQIVVVITYTFRG
jgi:hypothetical protein